MPTMANLTVKKSDAVTDIIYNALSAASGDGGWAKWRQDTGNGTPYAARPVLLHRVTESRAGIRRVEIQYLFPYFYTDSTTSQTVISPLNISFKNGVWTAPQGVPSAFMGEAAAQFSNLMAHVNMKTALTDQSAFT